MRCGRSDTGSFGQKNQAELAASCGKYSLCHIADGWSFFILGDTLVCSNLVITRAWCSPCSFLLLNPGNVLRAGQHYPGMKILGGVQQGKSLVVWQDRHGSILHAVGITLGQDWRQEAQQLLMQAILYGIKSLGWDEQGHAQGLQGGVWSAQCWPLCRSGLQQWPYFHFSLHFASLWLNSSQKEIHRHCIAASELYSPAAGWELEAVLHDWGSVLAAQGHFFLCS